MNCPECHTTLRSSPFFEKTVIKKCPHCDFSIMNEDDFFSYIRTPKADFSKIIEQPFDSSRINCPLCDRGFLLKYNFKNHPFTLRTCSYCSAINCSHYDLPAISFITARSAPSICSKATKPLHQPSSSLPVNTTDQICIAKTAKTKPLHVAKIMVGIALGAFILINSYKSVPIIKETGKFATSLQTRLLQNTKKYQKTFYPRKRPH